MFIKRGKKAQAAMEFLMTYGWAILIILIALGVLFYLGVFNPKTPSTCIAAAPLSCTDIKADSITQKITLVLGASAVQSAKLTAVAVTTPTGLTCTLTPVAGIDLSTAAPTAITTNACTPTANFKKDAKLAGTATVTYQLQGSTETHTTTVQFSGQVE